MSVELDTTDIEIGLLLEGVFRKYGSDFRQYSPSSVRRRITLALQRLELASVSRLQEKVLADPAAYDTLLQFLTVPTSEMFRDPSYYRSLREHVIPVLKTYSSLKIWIAGCSTGEEVYSMAILLREEGLLERSLIYATDINPVYLRAAQSGIYSVDCVRRYTANYQKFGGKAAFSDYYQAGLGSAIFDSSLHERVVFSDHSLATDSVFAEVQFVSCRNVLIYFNRALQDRAFHLFSDSLSNRGFLGLGSKETLRFSPVNFEFEELVREDKIYRKRRSL